MYLLVWHRKQEEELLSEMAMAEPRHSELWQSVNKDPRNAQRSVGEILKLMAAKATGVKLCEGSQDARLHVKGPQKMPWPSSSRIAVSLAAGLLAGRVKRRLKGLGCELIVHDN